MPLLPFADFLAGALLSLLLPVSLLIALTVWYMVFVRRAEESHGTDVGAPGTSRATPVDVPARSGEVP